MFQTHAHARVSKETRIGCSLSDRNLPDRGAFFKVPIKLFHAASLFTKVTIQHLITLDLLLFERLWFHRIKDMSKLNVVHNLPLV